jgi:hypothetical protein
MAAFWGWIAWLASKASCPEADSAASPLISVLVAVNSATAKAARCGGHREDRGQRDRRRSSRRNSELAEDRPRARCA